MLALSFAIEAMNAIPALIKAGVDIVAFIKKTDESLKSMQAEGRDPTYEEWEELNALVENLRAQRPVV